MYKKFQGDSLRLLGIEPQYWRKLDHILLHAFAKQTAKKNTRKFNDGMDSHESWS